MPKFVATYTEKLKIFYLPKLIFCSFFHNLWEVEEKVVYRKQWGVTDHLRKEIASEVNATVTSPICA